MKNIREIMAPLATVCSKVRCLMSMHSPLGYQIPDETARVAQAAFPKGNLYMQMQAELGMIYTNTPFASLFSSTGQKAEDPARLALILVMQELEGLPDRQAADAVRSGIDWKCATRSRIG